MIKKKFLLLAKRDSVGGASEWFFTLASTLVKYHYKVSFVVANRTRNYPFIIEIPHKKNKKSYFKRALFLLKRIISFKHKVRDFFSDPEYAFFPGENEKETYLTAKEILSRIPFIPDVIVTGLIYEFLNMKELLQLQKLTNASIYQTAFDVSVFTGGCHVMWDCEKYKTDCSDCPGIINKRDFSDFTINNLAEKKKNITEGKFGLILSGGWLLDKANQSAIYKNAVTINTGDCINTEIFSCDNRDIAKRVFKIPEGSKVILAGSYHLNDKRKGLSYLVEALSVLWDILPSEERESVFVFLIGHKDAVDEITTKIKFKKLVSDFIYDSRLLSLAYQASDIFACPSIEDAGPLMVVEAMACGTPVVGFEMGSLFDDSLVKNGINGYRVKMKDTHSLANSLNCILVLSQDDFVLMSKHAREAVVNLSSEKYFINVMSGL